MHDKSSEEIICVTGYLQEKPVVVADLDVLLCFPTLPFPSCSKTPSMSHSLGVLQEKSKCPRV